MSATEASIQQGDAARDPDRRPPRGRFWLAGVLAFVGMASLVLWANAAYDAYDGFAQGFQRASIPGTVTVDAHPGPYYVYVEGADAATVRGLSVRVTDPGGRSVPVRDESPGPVDYEHDGALGNLAASFEVPVGGMGEYRVAVTSRHPQGQVAVDDSNVATWITVHRWGAAALWLTIVAVSLIVVVAPGARRGGTERAHRVSLLWLFAGLPAAIVAAAAWSVFADPVTPHGNPRVEGWSAVLYELPGYLLVLAAVVTSLVFAARALRARARGGEWGLWASGAALLLVLLWLGTTVADTVTTPHSATLNWVVRGAAVIAALAVVLGARRWALRPAPVP